MKENIEHYDLHNGEYLVKIKMKYEWQQDYDYELATLFVYDGYRGHNYYWSWDWDEGQEEVYFIGIINVDDIEETAFKPLSHYCW